jgi:hypothetical protein
MWRVALLVFGCVVAAAALVLLFADQQPGGAGFALLVGGGSVVIACAWDQIKEFSLSPNEGLKVKTRKRERERDLSTDLTDPERLSKTVTVSEPAAIVEPTPGDVTQAEAVDVDEGEELLAADRVLAASWALPNILEAAEGGSLDGCEFELYLFDEDENLLLPMMTSYDAPVQVGWPNGQGATGVAYQTGEFVLATGDDVWNDTHHLTPERQRAVHPRDSPASPPCPS